MGVEKNKCSASSRYRRQIVIAIICESFCSHSEDAFSNLQGDLSLKFFHLFYLSFLPKTFIMLN